jgi:hypothetical protein
MCIGLSATVAGYELAANLSQAFAAAILLLTPLAFLFSDCGSAAGWTRVRTCCGG